MRKREFIRKISELTEKVDRIQKQVWTLEKQFMVRSEDCKGLNLEEHRRVLDPWFHGYHITIGDICDSITRLFKYLDIEIIRKEAETSIMKRKKK